MNYAIRQVDPVVKKKTGLTLEDKNERVLTPRRSHENSEEASD